MYAMFTELEKAIKNVAQKSLVLETVNIEQGQIDP